MFAPNRLLTPKEQWLLFGVVVAVLVGSITLVYHNTRQSRIDVYAPVARESIPGSQAREEIAPPETPETSSPLRQADSGPDIMIAELDLTSANEPEIIGVAVMGAVQWPDLYLAPAGTRLVEFIEMAGGAMDTADLSDIQLTAPGIDETTLTVPELPATKLDSGRISVRRASTGVINPPQYRKRPVAAGQPSTPLPAPHPVAGNVHESTSDAGLVNINTATLEQLQRLPGIGAVYAARIVEERQRRPFAAVDELTRVSGIGDKRLETLRPFVTAY